MKLSPTTAKVGLPYLQIPKKKEDTLRGGGGGVVYFTSELFVCEGAH